MIVSLYDTLASDLNTSLKAKDTLRTSTLRLLKSAIQYALIEKQVETADDELVLSVIRRQAKQRQDSIENYASAGRDALKEKEEAELKILEAYLPAQLSDDELNAIVKDVITSTGAQSKKDMGRVIKSVIEKAGGRADGKRISQSVSHLLV